MMKNHNNYAHVLFLSRNCDVSSSDAGFRYAPLFSADRLIFRRRLLLCFSHSDLCLCLPLTPNSHWQILNCQLEVCWVECCTVCTEKPSTQYWGWRGIKTRFRFEDRRGGLEMGGDLTIKWKKICYPSSSSIQLKSNRIVLNACIRTVRNIKLTSFL